MIVGIIGGNGVAATNKLCELIENRLTREGAFRDVQHPEMVIYQATKAPSRSMFLEGHGPSFIEVYVTIGKKLKEVGTSVLCMCCNTAHYAIDEIQNQVQIPFINIIEEVVTEAKKSTKKKIGIMASDGCLIGKVYEKHFEKIYPEAQLIYPSVDFQKEVTRGICNVKNKSRFLGKNHPDRPQTIFENVCNHLFENGAEMVILGCTDIRVDFEWSNSYIIDSLEVLVNKILNLTENGK
jgi:aspartate racemase